MVRTSKSEHLKSKISEAPNKNKEIWKIINQERQTEKTRDDKNLTLRIKNKTVKNPNSICEHFNNHFISVGQRTNKQSKQNAQADPEQNNQQHSLESFKLINKKDLQDIFKTLAPKNSSGFDGISNKILKFCQSEILTPLLDIINTSIIQAKVPEAMKYAIVYPKYKSGEKNNMENYRPISILPTLSKYLEKVIRYISN